MEQDVIEKLKMKSRDEVVAFLKSMWCEKPQPCPYCGQNWASFIGKRKRATAIGSAPAVKPDLTR